MQFRLFRLITMFLINTVYKFQYVKPNIKCFTNFNFQNIHKVGDIYSQKPTACSNEISNICRNFNHLRISFFEMQPFTMKKPRESTNLTSGIIQHIMHVAITECCGNCINIKDTRVYNHTWLSNIHARNTSDIRFPVFYDEHYRCDSNIIPLMKLSGAVFIIKRAVVATTFGRKIFRAIVALWPLLGLSLLLAYASGVVMWFVDTWSNKDHFPRRFLSGTFEGFWWSFISMTTVGYGDRSPKSIPAKLFACFWILCGITIISLLTAALTTAIEAVNVELRPSTEHGNIGILKNHLFEKSILLRGNAKIIFKESMEELSKALHRNEIEGILVDSYTVKSLDAKILVRDNLYIDKVINEQTDSYVGAVVEDKELFKLLYDYIDYQKDSIRDFVHRANDQLDEDNDMSQINANIIFTTKSGIFVPMLIVAGTILFCIIAIGVIYEIYRMKRKKVIIHNRSFFKITPKNLRREEERMEKELTELLTKWDKDLLQLIDNYTLHGQFTHSNTTYPNIMIKLQTKLASTAFMIDSHEYAKNNNNNNNNNTTSSQIEKKPSIKKKNSESIAMNGNNNRYHRFQNESFDEKDITPPIKRRKSNADKTRVKRDNSEQCEIDLEETEGVPKTRRKNKTVKIKREPTPEQCEIDLSGEEEVNNNDVDEEMNTIKKKRRKKKRNSIKNGKVGVANQMRPLPPIRGHEEV